MKYGKCGKCSAKLDDIKHERDIYSGAWGKIVDMLSVRHVCTSGYAVRNCFVCKTQIESAIITRHIVNCLHRISHEHGYIKLEYEGGSHRFASLYTIFSKYPQLLVIRELNYSWLDSDNNDSTKLLEIMAKKMENMDFSCVICKCNYETFPAKEILLAHLSDCLFSLS